MVQKLLYGVAYALFTILLFSNCTKEYSCENCNEVNKNPIANAGSDVSIELPLDSVLLDGSKSSDPDGKISAWNWRKITGPGLFPIVNSAAEKTLVKGLKEGIYQFELKVNDDKGASAKDTVQVTVLSTTSTNQPPIACAGTDQNITLPTNTINLDGSCSSDPDNNITQYQWTKISGPSSFTITISSAIQTQVSNLIEGIYQFELRVTDAGGLFSKDTVQVTVNLIANHPPVACAGADQTITLPANIANLDGSCSTDPDNNISTINGQRSQDLGHLLSLM